MLVDTGASVSLTNLPLPMTQDYIHIVGVGGTCIKAYKSKTVVLEVAGRLVPVQFFVCQNNEGTVLGIDILEELSILIDPRNHKIHWPHSNGNKCKLHQPCQNIATIGSVKTFQRDWDTEPQPFGIICKVLTEVWARDKQDTGKVPMDPVHVPGPDHKPHRQYPIKPEAYQAMRAIVQDLEERGVIRSATGTTNCPVWPVAKPDKTFRLTIDYTELNKVTPNVHPIVASPSTILNGLGPKYSIFMVLDIANGFWSVPLDTESQSQN